MDAALSLASAETAFAAHSVREDMRAAFLAAFADDGVFVRKGWTIARAHLAGQSAPAIVLDWRAQYVEVAASGEIGLSTGPWKITSKANPAAPPAFGQFVSVWRREPGQPWKVAVDLGIGHPQPALWDRPLETVAVQGEAPRGVAGIRSAEERFAAEARASLRAAYAKHGSAELRFYRDGSPPALGKAAAMTAGTMTDADWVWTVERIETSRANDFGYARGSYAARAAPATPAGHFLRVWRVEAGEWRIALDVTSPAPTP